MHFPPTRQSTNEQKPATPATPGTDLRQTQLMPRRAPRCKAKADDRQSMRVCLTKSSSTCTLAQTRLRLQQTPTSIAQRNRACPLSTPTDTGGLLPTPSPTTGTSGTVSAATISSPSHALPAAEPRPSTAAQPRGGGPWLGKRRRMAAGGSGAGNRRRLPRLG